MVCPDNSVDIGSLPLNSTIKYAIAFRVRSPIVCEAVRNIIRTAPSLYMIDCSVSILTQSATGTPIVELPLLTIWERAPRAKSCLASS